MINYLPNDPGATGIIPLRAIQPTNERAPSVARFQLPAGPPELPYKLDTSEFVHWQAREAALRAVAAWEAVDGPLLRWQPGKVLPLHPSARQELNAYYDRSAVELCYADVDGTRYYAGRSTDVVAHEIGHALLDARRPELFESSFFEVGAFHEAFGDCVALLTALADAEVRTAIVGRLNQANGVEATAEELAEAIGRVEPSHNAAAPRRARNHFRWDLWSNLPATGGPGALIGEWHSFGQIFSGCFYDLVVRLFHANGTTPADLDAAARAAGRLLAGAVRTAEVSEQFFRAVGRAMMLRPEATPLRPHIRAAFDGHGLPLGSTVAFAPLGSLASAGPLFDGAMVLSDGLRAELTERTGGGDPDGWTAMPMDLGGLPLVRATTTRRVALDAVDPRLVGVVAQAEESVLLDTTSFVTKIVGALPTLSATVREVELEARALVLHGRIAFDAEASAVMPAGTTHVIRKLDGQKTLVRARFACGCRPGGDR